MAKAKVCPGCWHEDCTCGTTPAQRQSDRDAQLARDAAARRQKEEGR